MSLQVITDWLSNHPIIMNSLIILGVVLDSYLSLMVARYIVMHPLRAVAKRSSTQLDDLLYEKGVFRRLVYIVPILILYSFAYLVPPAEIFLHRLFAALVVWIITITLGALLNAVNEVYKSTVFAKRLDIKSYLQVAKLELDKLLDRSQFECDLHYHALFLYAYDIVSRSLVALRNIPYSN